MGWDLKMVLRPCLALWQAGRCTSFLAADHSEKQKTGRQEEAEENLYLRFPISLIMVEELDIQKLIRHRLMALTYWDVL